MSPNEITLNDILSWEKIEKSEAGGDVYYSEELDMSAVVYKNCFKLFFNRREGTRTNSPRVFKDVRMERIRISSNEIDRLVSALKEANKDYRNGSPSMTDGQYDNMIGELEEADPDNEYLHKVEPEHFDEKVVTLPEPMLSTDKVYTEEDLGKWLNKVRKSCKEMHENPIEQIIRITPKLDGYSGYWDGEGFYTRGDGLKGTDITLAIDRGLQVIGGKNVKGPGEIVVKKEYFEEFLSEKFSNTRNIIASVIKESEWDIKIALAAKTQNVVFQPFSVLEKMEVYLDEVPKNIEIAKKLFKKNSPYDMDGIILEVVDAGVKEYMACNKHHHHWMVAVKENTEIKEAVVEKVIPNVSRTGRINPIVVIEETVLSGAKVTRVTAHHYTIVKNKGIGKGALVKVTRSGEVIPKIEDVVKPAICRLPATCPSCKQALQWDSVYLVCTNMESCPAQREGTLGHFFDVIGLDGFGPAAVKKLVDFEIYTIAQVYNLTKEEWVEAGFGEGQTKNLMKELRRSKSIDIKENVFLAGFGQHRLSRGNAEKILKEYGFDELFELYIEDIENLKGFAEITARDLYLAFQNIKDEVYELLDLCKFKLVGPEKIEVRQSPITGMVLVFTGKMQGNRKEMQEQAKVLGATIGSGVNGKTTYLVTGEKVGQSKLQAAEKNGVQVITEDAYYELIKG